MSCACGNSISRTKNDRPASLQGGKPFAPSGRLFFRNEDLDEKTAHHINLPPFCRQRPDPPAAGPFDLRDRSAAGVFSLLLSRAGGAQLGAGFLYPLQAGQPHVQTRLDHSHPCSAGFRGDPLPHLPQPQRFPQAADGCPRSDRQVPAVQRPGPGGPCNAGKGSGSRAAVRLHHPQRPLSGFPQHRDGLPLPRRKKAGSPLR